MPIEFWVMFALGAAILQLLPGAGKRCLLSYARSGRPLRTLAAAIAVTLSATAVMGVMLVVIGFVMSTSALLAAVIGGFGLSVLLVGAMIAWRVKGMTGLIADNDNLSETKPLQTFGKIALDNATDRWQALLSAALASQFVSANGTIFSQAIVLTATFFAISLASSFLYILAPNWLLMRLRRLESRKIKGRARGCLRVSTGIVTVGYRRLAA